MRNANVDDQVMAVEAGPDSPVGNTHLGRHKAAHTAAQLGKRVVAEAGHIQAVAGHSLAELAAAVARIAADIDPARMHL